MPFFNIIVVSYDPGERLEASLSSILSQSEGGYRVTVKDAGSTDGSWERARARFDDDRIEWLQSADKGIYDGMNQALDHIFSNEEAADDGLVYFLNCGDLLHDDQVLARVKDIVTAAHKADPMTAVFYGDVVERVSGERVAANPVLDEFACFRALPSHQACFYDAKAIRSERFDLRYRVRGDYEHFLRLVFRNGVKTVPMDMVICDYEGGGFSETPKGRRLSAEEHRVITEAYFSKKQIRRWRLYLALTLQPLREKLARGKLTAGIYNKVRARLLRRS